jgi:hypothetical protein
MKTAVVFPNDTTLWIGSQSCFQFDQSINEISTFKSNTNAKRSDYNVGSNVYFTLRCDASGYTGSAYNNPASNNIRCNIQQNQTGTLYGLNDYISQINNAISAANKSNNYFFSFDRNINVSSFVLNSTTNNYLRMRFYIQKKFTTRMYLFDASASNCLFYKILNFNYHRYDLSNNNSANIHATAAQAYTYYTISNGVLFRLYPDSSLNLGNQNADSFQVYLDCSNVFHNHYGSSLSTSASGTNFYYDTANQQFVNAQVDNIAEIFNWAIRNWKDPILNNYPLSNSSIVISRDASSNQYSSYYNLNSIFDLSINTLLNVKNYRIIFTDNANNSWNNYLFLDNSYNLQDWSYNTYLDSSYSYATYMPENKQIYGNLITLYKNKNNWFYIEPNASGVSDPTNANRIKIEIDASANGTNYTLNNIINQINAAFDSFAKGSHISTDAYNNVYIRINYSKIYNTTNYRLVFYDPFSFVRCYIGATSVKNTNWDTTIGWILGFRQLTEYPLGNEYIEYDANDDTITYYQNTTSYYTYDSSSNIATIVGDTTVSVNLYNYFMIILNDYAQNRLNDGLVGISSQQTSITTNSYANRSNYTCDPVSGNKIFLGTYTNYNNNTQNEIYSENQKILSTQQQVKKYGNGTFVHDVFAIIPLNVGNLSTGSIYVETGSGLQKQERIYFGPVNLSRMNIQLVTDRGDSVDLNGSDWSCTLQCDQFYQNKNI